MPIISGSGGGGSKPPIQNYFGFSSGVTVHDSTYTFLPWGTATGTQLFNFAGDPTKPLATKAGLYTIAAETWIDPGAAAAGSYAETVVFIDIAGVNDGPGQRMPLAPVTASAMIWSVTATAVLAVGMQVGIQVWHNAGGDRTFYSWVLATAQPT